MLVRLEVDNFKSYKGFQTLGPFLNFTAVIGPNGSGKSNLMDAISFVLGVRSQHLRASHLRNLVYGAGTLLAAEKAYVRAVYRAEGSEEDTVFYRSVQANGSSEYRVNSKVVTQEIYLERLGEINVLSKARNFLVFQGDVESIASKSPKDLTLLFEQISGSGAIKGDYEHAKTEKDKAEEELKDFHQRRKGINSEKKQFKEQKEEADKFEKLTHSRDQITSQYYLFQLWGIQKQTRETLEMQMRILDDVERARTQQQEAEKKEKLKRRAYAKEHTQWAKYDDQIKKKNREMKKIKPKATKLSQEIDHCVKKIEKEKTHLARAEEDVSRQTTTIERLQKKVDEISRLKTKFEAEIAGDSNGIDIHLQAAQLEQYNELKLKSVHTTTGVQSKIDENLRIMKIARENYDREAAKLKQYKATLLAQNSRVENLEARKVKLLAQIEEHEKKVEVLREEVNQESSLLKLNDTKLEHARAQLVKIDGQLREAKADKHESEREQKFMECLEDMKRLFPGVKGRLMDLCSPAHKRYNAAITVVMGKNMDAIVVDTVETAKSCMQYLRVQKGGVATFIPLQTIESKSVGDRMRDLGGTKKPVVDVIKYSSDITKAIEYACGNAVVCDTLGEAKALCFDTNGRASTYKCVTLDGTLIRKSGVMTGGLTGVESRAAKWEQKAVDELKRERIKFQREMTEISNSNPSAEREIQDKKSMLASQEQRLTQFQQDLEITMMNLEKLKNQGEGLNTVHIEEEMERHLKTTTHAEETAGLLEKEKDALVDQVFAKFCMNVGINNIREYEGTEIRVQRERARKMLEFQSTESRLLSTLQFEKSRIVSSQVKIVKKTISELEAEFQILEEQFGGLRTAVAETEKEIATLTEEQREFKTVVDIIDGEVKDLKKIYLNASADFATAQQKLVSKGNDIDQSRNKRRSLLMACMVEEIDIPLKSGNIANVALSGIHAAGQDDMDIDGAEVKMLGQEVLRDDGIEIDFSPLPEEILELDDPNDVASVSAQYTEKLKKIANKIDNMAPNMKAVEKLDGVRKRLKTIEAEFEAARERAEDADSHFRAMQTRRYNLFYKAYKHVSEQIDNIYKELTKNAKSRMPGGTAYLTLESNEEPYLYGVKYNTMPPSKRFRDMEQLSGGEKTVAALALLFAIHSFRPSPFFIMDEIDAALDAVNVHKVATYIKARSADFQCIVISLKDSFYSKADGIVGIYRDKQSESSNSVTLDLRPYPEHVPNRVTDTA